MTPSVTGDLLRGAVTGHREGHLLTDGVGEMAVTRSEDDVIGVESTAVMTSPALMPAVSAGPPAVSFVIVAPPPLASER